MSTHRIQMHRDRVVKQYSSWSRGEPTREWAALVHLDEHAPGLAPRPLFARLDCEPPRITMSVLAGQNLPPRPLGPQLDGLAEALERLWSVPIDSLLGTWERGDSLSYGRRLVDLGRPSSRLLARARAAAAAWWASDEPALLRSQPARTVLGHRDPNLSNYLWDGHRTRIVDFEDAALSDPAEEVGLLVEHLGSRQLDADQICVRFDVDRDRLLASRRLWAMFWLWMLLPGGPAARRNSADAADRQAERLLALLG